MTHPTDVERISLQLAQTQWFSPDELAAYQLDKLRTVISQARNTVPYFQDLFQSEIAAEVTFDSFRTLPVLTRRDLQTLGTLLVNSSYPHESTQRIFTSGSTGTPTSVLTTPLTQAIWRSMGLRDHQWHQRDLSQKLAAIRYNADGLAEPPHGSIVDNWGDATSHLRTGPCAVLSIWASVREQAVWLMREDPTYLLTYPTVLESLVDYWAKCELPIPNMQQLRTFGEVVEPKLRTQIRKHWNIPLIDLYSCEETGYIAIQCPLSGQYHLMSDDLLIEVVDDQNQPCLPGEVGRVLVTTLHNFAMPLLRYEIGDFAEVGHTCACGRGLPVIKRILGRKRNMFTFEDGSQVWPSFSFSQNSGMDRLPIRQFQVIQKKHNLVEVLLVTDRALNDEERQLITASLRSGLRRNVEIILRFVSQIYRSPSGKFEDYVSEV